MCATPRLHNVRWGQVQMKCSVCGGETSIERTRQVAQNRHVARRRVCVDA
jgi:hypothetical protein